MTPPAEARVDVQGREAKAVDAAIGRVAHTLGGGRECLRLGVFRRNYREWQPICGSVSRAGDGESGQGGERLFGRGVGQIREVGGGRHTLLLDSSDAGWNLFHHSDQKPSLAIDDSDWIAGTGYPRAAAITPSC